MTYGICTVSVSPLRAEASDRSEMVSQLLFGEKVKVLEKKKNWLKIQADYDGYEGWTDTKHIKPLAEEVYNQITTKEYASDLYNFILENELPGTLTIGAHLPNLENGNIHFDDYTAEYLGDTLTPVKTREQLIEFAHLYLNVPYLWGGKSSFGIDCSGFTQQVYKLCGIALPRDAYQQAEIGNVLSFVEEALPGDLAFFDNEEGHIIHVGIILEDKKILHAHGKVRIDMIDSTGIFNVDSQSYSHQLRFIRNLLD